LTNPAPLFVHSLNNKKKKKSERLCRTIPIHSQKEDKEKSRKVVLPFSFSLSLLFFLYRCCVLLSIRRLSHSCCLLKQDNSHHVNISIQGYAVDCQ
jgi:hypothetical protein